MPLQTPVADSYVSCVNLPATLGSVAFTVESGGFKPDVATDETTNSQGQGFYEDQPTITKASGSHKIAYKTPLGLVSGRVYTLIINTTGLTNSSGVAGTGTPYFSGNVRVSVDGSAVLDAKAALHIPISWTSQGPFAYAF